MGADLGEQLLCEVVGDSLEVTHGGAGHHQSHSLPPSYLDHSREHAWVVVAEDQRRHSHYLWDGTEVEDGLVPQPGHVEELVGHMAQGVGDEKVEASKC